MLTSQMMASDFVISGSSPNVSPRLFIVGPATELAPSSLVAMRAIVPLPERLAADDANDLLLRRVRRQRVAVPVLQQLGGLLILPFSWCRNASHCGAFALAS